jgi:exonuclease III
VETAWNKEWGAEIIYSHGSSSSRGVAILFPQNLEYKVQNIVKDNNGRFIIVELIIDDTRFVLVNLYAPTKDKVDDQCTFLAELRTELLQYSGHNLIMGGDFNTILNGALDKNGGTVHSETNYGTALGELIEDFELTDIWVLGCLLGDLVIEMCQI